MKKLIYVLIIIALIYAGIGLALHVKWKSDRQACQALKANQGELVEPEVYGGIIGLAFTMIYWSVYTLANIHHFGTPFPPCRVSEQ